MSTETTKTVREMIAISVPFSPTGELPTMPDVPLAPGIDIEALRLIDPKPLIVTRPLGFIGGLSINGLVYDDYLLSEIERQVNEKRPPARRGHVSEQDKNWKVPDSVGFWVGALRVGDTLYGKAFILPGRPFYDEVKVSEVIGSGLSNSIYGEATMAVGSDGTKRCIYLALESIDFVPPERASLQELGGEFQLTSEMTEGDKNTMTDDLEEMKQKIASLKPNELHEMLTAEQRQHCAEMHLKQCDVAKVREMLSETQRHHVMETRMSEVSPEETYKTLSEVAKKAFAEMYAAETKQKLVVAETVQVQETAISEMTSTQTQLKAQLAEMQMRATALEQTVAGYEREKFERARADVIHNQFSHLQVRTEEGKKKVASLEATLLMHTVAEMAGSTKLEDIEPAVKKAYEKPDFKPLAEMTIASLSGPNAIVGAVAAPGGGAQRFGYDPNTGRYSDEAVAQAVTRTNVLRETGGAK